jgi:invasion protein IalB
MSDDEGSDAGSFQHDDVEILMAWTQKMAATAAVASGLLVFGHQAMAQWAAKPPPSATTAPTPGTPSSPDQPPDHTTATFGDWTLRCDRRLDLTPPQRVCELGLVIQKPGETAAQAQIALGRVARGETLRITAVLPPNVALKTNPKVVIEGQEPPSTELSWTRCIAGGCFADAAVSPALLNSLRSRTEPGRLDYRDGTDREMTLPISFRGVKAALDALAREEAN